MPWIYLVLIVRRAHRRTRRAVGQRRRSAGSSAAGDALLARPPDAAAADGTSCGARRQPHAPVRSVEAERPNFRSRMSKARNALAGTLLGIRSRSGITDETWDDLEEALLRADVGVRVTDDLLSGLRTKVKAKEITEPEQLLEALQAEMVDRLAIG